MEDFAIDWNGFADYAATKTGTINLDDSGFCAIGSYLHFTYPDVYSISVSFTTAMILKNGTWLKHTIPKNIADYIEARFRKDDENTDAARFPWPVMAKALKEMGYGNSNVARKVN